MYRVYNLLKPVVVVVMALGLARCHSSCKPAESPIGPLDAPYAAETLACSNDAKTATEALECRRKVNWKYGLCPDDNGWGVPC